VRATRNVHIVFAVKVLIFENKKSGVSDK